MSNRKRRGRSEGSIYQRKDGTWTASISLGYSADNKRKRKVVYGSTKKEVQDKLQALQQQATAGLITSTTKTSVADFMDQWIADSEKNHAASTIDRYKLIARNIREHLSRIPVSALRPAHVQMLFNDMDRAGHSRDAQMKTGRLLSVACRRAIKLGLLAVSPVSDLPRPERAEIRLYDIDQLRIVMEGTKEHRIFRAFIPLCIDSGCRLRELLALEWRDFDFDRNSVTIIRTLSEVRGKIIVKQPKTKAGRRRITLAPSTVQALRNHQQALQAENHSWTLVFPSEAGTYLLGSNVLKSFKTVLKKLRLPEINLHSLRHSSASVLAQSGASAKLVQERMGHSKVDTTLSIYTHLFQSAQDEAADVFEQRLHGTGRPASENRAES